ncbi:MAG: DUF4079 domain-containing protein [Cyanobacteria bacterium P01_A01_bin.37]
MSTSLSQFLEPIASWFGQFDMPEPIVHWGHPLMMGIVVFAMGSAAGITGWRGRMMTDSGAIAENLNSHKKIAPLMFAFITMGYTGGLLSLVMQGQPLLESPHFWTGSVVLGLLALNGAIAAFGFSKGKAARTAHAYLGSAALGIMVLHALFGLKLGLSI